MTIFPSPLLFSSMPTLPFCKIKTESSPVLALPAPKTFIGDKLDEAMRQSAARSARSVVIDIGQPWAKRENKVQMAIKEYQTAYPSRHHPSTTDLIEWLYERMLAAENEAYVAKVDSFIAHGSRTL